MRVRGPSLLVLALWGTPALAQGGGPTFGLHVGYSRASFVADSAVAGAARERTAAFVDVFGSFDVAGPFGLDLGAAFASKGGEFPAESSRSLALDLELSYLELPVLAHLRPSLAGGRLRPLLYAGAAPSFRVGCDAAIRDAALVVTRFACTDTLASGGDTVVVNLERNLRDVDLVLVAGAGVELRQRSWALRLEARLSEGLAGIEQESATGSSPRNRQWAILLGFGF